MTGGRPGDGGGRRVVGSESDEQTGAGLSAADLAVDGMVAHLSGDMNFLLHVTPVNVEDARHSYLSGGGDNDPEFHYRNLSVDPDVLLATLEAVPVSDVADPELAALLRAKVRELRLQVEMLRARNTEEFLPLGLQLYGTVLPSLADRAADLVDRLPPGPASSTGPGPAPSSGALLDADQILALARAELDHYRALDPEATMHAEIRPDVTGILVNGDTLLISEDAAVDPERADAVLQHEVGTHLLTRVNGDSQPVRCLGVGLAGYEETQEGLAVLAEIACGGLTPNRLRQLAARVVTIHRMATGSPFGASFQALLDAGFTPPGAFGIAMRAYRSGGFPKDAIYLRGLLELLAHLADGGSLAPLWTGKFALCDLPLIEDLAARGALLAPRLTPRYLTDPLAADRLARAAATDDLVDLLERAT